MATTRAPQAAHVASISGLDDDACYRAVCSRDARFDGRFFIGVTSTGIYCRPSCPAKTPGRARVGFYRTAAAAQLAGFRACKRCRPDATPGSPEWDIRADAVGRAMRLIADGIVDREGVAGLAGRLGYSARHLQRLLQGEVGAGPLALARSQRAQTARILLETTEMRIGEVAFAAGFASVRQFNDTIREVFATSPGSLRANGSRGRPEVAPGTIALRLAHRSPLAVEPLFEYLAARAVPGIEEGDATSYRRTLALPRGTGIVEVRADGGDGGQLGCVLRLDDVRDLTAAVRRVRRLLDLDADPVAVDEALASDGRLRPLVRARPGLRSPGHVDGNELAVRAVLGQQVSVRGARTVAARLVLAHGAALAAPVGTLTHLFPAPGALASLDPASLPMPASRARALVGLARALEVGDLVLDDGVDRDEVDARLQALPGVGPWTAAYVRLRALGDPDCFLASDLGVRKALGALGLPTDVAGASATAARWRPWRSYALAHLWTSLGSTGEPTVHRRSRRGRSD